MAMQFNPQTAFLRGMDLGSPTTSQGGINNLLNMQQATLGGMVDSFGNIGKTSRTNTVNDLIARGGLEGLNEAQTQARIQQEAGGTLTPEGQANVDKLLQTTGKEDQRKFTTGERVAGQDFSTKERLGGQEFKTGERIAGNEFSTSERLAGEKFQGTQKEADRALDKLLKEKQISSNEKMNSMQVNATLRGQYKQEAGADGFYHNIYPDGSSVKTTVPVNAKDAGTGTGSGGKGTDPLKLTGRALSFHNELSGKGKDAFEQMYSTGDLQVGPAERIKMKDGTIKEQGYKVLYKGKPMTILEVKQMVERKK